MTLKSQPRRILVIKLRHVGDVLLVTPVLQSLHEAFPAAELHVCANERTDGVLTTNPLVKRIHCVPITAGWGANFRVMRALRRERFDLVLDFTGSDRSAILARLSGAPERWGYFRAKGFWGRNLLFTRTARRKRDCHVVEQQAELLREMGVAASPPRLSYTVRREDRDAVARLLTSNGSYAHFHPVSRLMVKTWPVAFMAQLIEHIQSRGLQAVVTASNDSTEAAWVGELRSAVRQPFIDLSGRISLPQLAAVAERSRVFIGVDSAPLHIAAAVGTPVIGIFGPSSETLWGPWCEHKLVLSRSMDCRLPCKMKNTCPHIACLREMTPDMVLPRVDEFLRSLKL